MWPAVPREDCAGVTEEAMRDEGCGRALAALARGGPDIDWQWVDGHLTTCAACSAGLARFTLAVNEQVAGSSLLDAAQAVAPVADPPATHDVAAFDAPLPFDPAVRTAGRT